MEFDELKKQSTVILHKDIEGIPACTLGIIDEIFDNETINTWELSEKYRKYFNNYDLEHLQYYWRMNTMPVGNEIPWE
jgi:hypothetical protein